jgi:hypothetical protein
VSGARLGGTGLLADDLFLMAHSDRTGRPLLQPRAVGLGLAGALLAELTLQGRVRVFPGGVMVTDRSPPAEELALRVLRALLGEHEQLPAQTWLLFLGRSAAQDVAGRLERSGYLIQGRARRLWRSPPRWVPVNADWAFAPVARVQAALRSPRPGAVEGVTLAGLADACGLGAYLSLYLPPDARRRLDEAVGQLGRGLQEVIAQTRAAVDSAVLAHRT